MRFVPEYPPISSDPILSEWAYRELNRLFADVSERLEFGLKAKQVSVTAAYTVQDVDFAVIADATSGAVTVTLPDAHSDRVVSVKKVDASNNVTIATPSSETIDGAATKVLSTQYDAVILIADGSNWHIL
jgi:hypothetical protein